MSTIDAREVRDLGQGETLIFSACFARAINGATISSVVSVTQKEGPGTLTIGSATINSVAPVVVDGISQPAGTVVQVEIAAGASLAAGLYRVDVVVVTSAGETVALRCWLRVTA